MTLGELRKKNNMTQAELADRLGIRQQSVQAIEAGNARPSIDVAQRIMKEFHLSGAEIWTMFYDAKKEAMK